MYRTSSGELVKTLYSKKYGCSCVTFTHASQAVLYASKVGLIDTEPNRTAPRSHQHPHPSRGD